MTGRAAMYDLSMPNAKPGTCDKCRGSGQYSWGAVVNGVPSKSGTCWSCAGTGRQDGADIKRNRTYNKFKIARIMSYDFDR
jgi:DnaJ-class molecular chaperone